MQYLDKDIVFTSEGTVIHSPLRITSDTSSNGSTIFTVSNLGSEKTKSLGLFTRVSSNVGPGDYPAEYSPHADLQDLLRWGQESAATVNDATPKKGGLKITHPLDAEESIYITRGKGSQWINRIVLDDLLPGESLSVKVEFEVPDSIDARRLFVDVVVG